MSRERRGKMMLDKDDAKKLATAALIWKFFSSRKKTPSSLPPADPSYRPRYFRRWLASLIILSGSALWVFKGGGYEHFEFVLKYSDPSLLSLVYIFALTLYGTLWMAFIIWTIKKIFLMIFGVLLFLFRKVF